MRVAITGASGLVGRALGEALAARGDEVIRLVRRPEQVGPGAVHWDPAAGTIDADGLRGIDGLVHLAGESVAGGRWTEARKARIRESRMKGTGLVASALASLEPRPAALVSASAIGFYGVRGDAPIDEDSPPGEGFLAEVCQAWEAACDPAREAGIRVVNARTGVVLAREGGALSKMAPAFRMGLGGMLGDGHQYMSWVALDDVVGGLLAALDGAFEGPLNLVAPGAVTNEEFTRTLGRVLRRPTAFRVPAFAARLGLGGQMAEEMLLGGARIVPAKLRDAGFEWRYGELEAALRAALG